MKRNKGEVLIATVLVILVSAFTVLATAQHGDTKAPEGQQCHNYNGGFCK